MKNDVFDIVLQNKENFHKIREYYINSLYSLLYQFFDSMTWVFENSVIN
jgi:hypothetical protein